MDKIVGMNVKVTSVAKREMNVFGKKHLATKTFQQMMEDFADDIKHLDTHKDAVDRFVRHKCIHLVEKAPVMSLCCCADCHERIDCDTYVCSECNNHVVLQHMTFNSNCDAPGVDTFMFLLEAANIISDNNGRALWCRVLQMVCEYSDYLIEYAAPYGEGKNVLDWMTQMFSLLVEHAMDDKMKAEAISSYMEYMEYVTLIVVPYERVAELTRLGIDVEITAD